MNLFDKVISVTLLARCNIQKLALSSPALSRNDIPRTKVVTESEDMAITIPFLSEDGYKPNVNVTLTMLPGGISFNMHVVVKNAQIMKNVDIQNFFAMSIRLGYTGGHKEESEYTIQTFTGPVMASYIESPPPDLTIVFDGVAVGYTGIDIMQLHPYILHFNPEDWTIKDVFVTIAQQLKLSYDYTGASDEILNTKLNFQAETVTASNAYKIISWMQSVFSAFAKNISFKEGETYDANQLAAREGVTVFVQYRNDKLYLISSDKKYSDTEIERCIPLTCIKTASFTGPVINISAPYNPELQPGDIFYLDPVYYTGGVGLLNSMTEKVYNPSAGCYRIIKMDVSFASIEQSNEMTIMAIGVEHYSTRDGQSILGEDTDVIIKRYNQEAEEQQRAIQKKVETNTVTEITVGKASQVNPVDAPDKAFWSSTWTPAVYGTIHMYESRFEHCSTFQDVAMVLWGDKVLYVDNQHMSRQVTRTYPNGVPCWFFYPLIQLTTYKDLKSKGGILKSGKYNNFMEQMIDLNAPDAVDDNWTLVAPQITDFKDLLGDTQAAEVMKNAGLYRQQLGDFEGCVAMIDCYNYLMYGSR